MVSFHEILGPILASVAVILAILLFKKNLDFQAYREIDSDYTDVLKMGMEKPFLRDKYLRDKASIVCPTDESKKDIHDKEVAYNLYAFMVWNILETIYDRDKINETWYPVIKYERSLHLEWFRENNNKKKFKKKFVEFIENADHFKDKNPPRLIWKKISNKLIYLGLTIATIAAVLTIPFAILPGLHYDIEYFDRYLSLDCARNPEAYNVSHVYDCTEFSSGSLAELCVPDHQAFNKTDKKGCSAFIQPKD